jgi:catechol 2,3-dioxygenase-like lactoylglutathione lyase family enzyme
MIDHVTIDVSDYARSRAFYEAALAPLGFGVVTELDGACGFGPPGVDDFWLGAAGPSGPSGPIHIAFAAEDERAVDAFYAAALAAGGRDNGAPGERPQYHPGYYGAYVFDPDGNNVEAVFHRRD